MYALLNLHVSPLIGSSVVYCEDGHVLIGSSVAC
jgi:hypothetical protein